MLKIKLSRYYIILIAASLLLVADFAIGQNKDSLSTQKPSETDAKKASSRYVKWSQAAGEANGSDLRLKATLPGDSLYQYVFGTKEIQIDSGDSLHLMTVFLSKNDSIYSEINFEVDFRNMPVGNFSTVENIQITDVDQTFNFQFGGGFCGSGWYNALFFRRDNHLIKGFLTYSYAEPKVDYDIYEIIPPSNGELNEVWVEYTAGDKHTGENSNNYFTEIIKYRFEDDSLTLMNPVEDNFQYVTAKNGLKVRNAPSTDSHVYETLPFGTKVNVKIETNRTMEVEENDWVVKGKWVQIGYLSSTGKLIPAYVFNGFLDDSRPDKE